jgi:hypothetical protein
MVKQKIHQLCTKRSQKALDSVICLDDDIKANLNNDETEKTLQDTTRVAEVKIENVDEESGIAITISSDEESIQSGNDEVKNQHPLKLKKKRQTLVKNKKFKCAQCFFRANWPSYISRHFKMLHWQVPFNDAHCIQVLDEKEATRTLAAYEKNHVGQFITCKPYKCGKCEFRATRRTFVYFHMREIHHVEIAESRRLVEVLPLDEAEKTVKEYNKKFTRHRLRFLQEKENMKSVANDSSTASKDQSDQLILQTDNNSQTADKNGNKKLKCIKCFFRSNSRENVLQHFKITHWQVAFNPTQCVQVLDEKEAARTIAAYEKKHAGKICAFKPYKCGECEYRATYKYNAYYHMQKVHKVNSFEAIRLVEVLSLDEAQKKGKRIQPQVS